MFEVSAVVRNGHKRKGCLGHLLRGKIQKGKEMTERLQKKVDRAIRLLQSIPTEDGPIEVCYSGGKLKEVLRGNAWNFAYYMLWCSSSEDYIEKTTVLFPMEETPEQLVKRYFEIK